MDQPQHPVAKDIVLIGGGHSHVAVLKRFGMKPVPGVRLTLICRDTHTPYSGMLPGYVAGHYTHDEVHIDLRRLAAFAGARFFRDKAVGLDRQAQLVHCAGRPPVPYDLLSINIGSTPRADTVEGARESAVPLKPIATLDARVQALLQRVRERREAPRIAMVGGGAAGVELSLALQYRLRHELAALGRVDQEPEIHIFNAAPQILASHNARVRSVFDRVLSERGIQVHNDTAVTRVMDGQVKTSRCNTVAADEIIWATQAGGAPWLRETGLAVDDAGFLQVADTLQTVSDPKVFAAGDIATMVNHPRAKAGVFAVRMGAPLAANLRRAVRGERPADFHPQKDWLALISTGDKHAVASRGGLCVEGDWVWRWKDWIDQRFMAKYSDLPRMSEDSEAPSLALALDPEEQRQAISAVAMRCGGCGAKVGASTLANAMRGLSPVDRADVLVGLNAPDDAAVVRVPPGKAMVHTVDFFRAFVDDPYVFGRVAANHALGDIFAMGASAQTATAIATVPSGLERKIEDTVRQMMTGAMEMLDDAGCALVGGHTGEGRELALGFAINGLIDDVGGDSGGGDGGVGDGLMRKGGMRPGDVLLLTKPLGTGTLFAAYPKLDAKGRWIDNALTWMMLSNRVAAEVLHAHGARAATDITGFGLLGHLVEMTRPSGVDAEIDLSALPILDGAEETVAAGVLSSLQPANVRLRRALRNQSAYVDHPRYPLLFDPQTAGGLLASVPAEAAEACLAELRRRGYTQAAQVGRVMSEGEPVEPVVLAG